MKRKATALATMMMSMLVILSVAVSSAAAVDPYMTVDKSVSPTEIYLKGDGAMPDTATVIMSIAGAGDPIPGEETYVPTDVVVVFDDTSSMSSTIGAAKDDINYITDTLVAEIPDIRFGLVSYKDSAHRDLALTSDVDAFRGAIGALFASGGGDWREEVEGALLLGYASSWRSGDVAKVVILIGDAPAHNEAAAEAAATAAYADEYGIYTNAICVAPDSWGSSATVAREHFERIANNGHGAYSQAGGGAGVADAIIDSITTVVPSIDTAGEDVVVTEVVPTYIEASSFSPAPTTSAGDTYTWDFGKVGIGETKTITFDVKCIEAGDDKPVDVYPATVLTYKAWDGTGFNTPTTIPFPETCIDCIVSNIPPDVSDARPSIDCLWPPNNKFVDLTIEGITDPDGDEVTITITGITSDEPTASIEGAGGAKHAPDADPACIGTAIARVRAERSGGEDGRVYEITFVASDGIAETEGSVFVKVPHDQSDDCVSVDSGQNYDATDVN